MVFYGEPGKEGGFMTVCLNFPPKILRWLRFVEFCAFFSRCVLERIWFARQIVQINQTPAILILCEARGAQLICVKN